MMFADTTFATAQDLAARCARRTMNTWHVLDDRGHYLIADDAAAAAWGDRVVWSVEPEQAFSAVELDGPIERYGTCDEPTEDGTPCGCHFLLPSGPDKIALCPSCGSSAIIEPSYT